jgi:hypothetical protein
LRAFVAGIPIAVVDVETPPFVPRELVAPIQEALAAVGLE